MAVSESVTEWFLLRIWYLLCVLTPVSGKRAHKTDMQFNNEYIFYKNISEM